MTAVDPLSGSTLLMLHSTLTNEMDFKMDDPRIPKIIRALHPVSIILDTDIAVQIDGSNQPPEYFLMRVPGHTNTWVLCAAGPPIRFGPRELLRIEAH